MNRVRNFAKQWLIVMCVAWLICCIGGCSEHAILRGDEEIHHVTMGDPAPITGWIISDAMMSQIYDLLGDQIPLNSQ